MDGTMCRRQLMAELNKRAFALPGAGNGIGYADNE